MTDTTRKAALAVAAALAAVGAVAAAATVQAQAHGNNGTVTGTALPEPNKWTEPEA
jgi:hypothetical protein